MHNFYRIKYKSRGIRLGIFISVLLLFCRFGIAQESLNPTEIQLLISRLSLNAPELNWTESDTENPQIAIKKLLHFYKTRTNIKHPAQNSENEEITERDITWANDALKHIFVGQPAYKSFYCGEDIDWGSLPVPDNEWVWQLNRMYFWNSMANVYTQTKEEKYAAEWSRQIIHWVKNNPRDEAHNYAWRSIETGIRGYNWTHLFYRFLQSPHLNEETLVYILNSLYDHAEFLMTVYRSNSNWGLMEAEGLAFIAITFPEFREADKWRTEAFRRLNNEISIQVYPDGHQRELAMGYHLGCIRWFYRTFELAKMNGIEDAFPTSYLDKIEKMCEVPMKICLPDGTNVQFGDAWRGEPGQHNKKFREWAEMFNREDFLYLASGGREGKAPEQTAFALKESGIYSMRSSWDSSATCLVLKCGPDGGGHCQPDNGTFALYAGGRNLMPDAGSYIYSGDPEGRRWFRQTKIHQTLTLNGENTMYSPKLLKWQAAENLDVLVVENAGYENLTHRRTVLFVDKSYFIFIDEAIGTGTGNVDLHFQFAPGPELDLSKNNFFARTKFETGWNVLVKTQKQNGLELIEEEGWVSFEYTKKESRPATCYRRIKTEENPVRFVTVVAPYENSIPEIEFLKTNFTDNKISIELIYNGKEKLVTYNL